MKYILKNKDIDILEFEVNEKASIQRSVNVPKKEIENIVIHNQTLLPVNIEANNITESLQSFIKHRKAPSHRRFMQNLMRPHNSNELMGYIDVSLGLSLNDSYWIMPANKDYKWKDINLYKHPFNETLALVAFGIVGSHNTNDVSPSPEYTTNGILKKCWHRENDGEIYLYKGNAEVPNDNKGYGGKETYSEYYMAQIAKVLGFDCVPYDLKEFHNQVVSSCPLFTNENEGFVPIHYFLDKESKKLKGIELVDELEKIYDKDKLADMLMFDSIIGNTDRHLGNFGMIVDNNTKEILRPAPIFDNGLSMFNYLYNDEINDISDLDNIGEIVSKTSSFLELDFDIQLKIFVQDRHASALEKLQSFTFTRHPKYNLGEEWLQPIEKYINKRATMALEFINEKTKENHQDLEETKTRHRKRKGR